MTGLGKEGRLSRGRYQADEINIFAEGFGELCDLGLGDLIRPDNFVRNAGGKQHADNPGVGGAALDLLTGGACETIRAAVFRRIQLKSQV